MGRREEKKQEKRERLEEAGLSAFDALGYDRASIEQIAAEAEVARGTFYLYYADKLALFRAIADRWFVPVRGLLQDTAEQVAAARTPDEIVVIWSEMGVGLALLGLTFPRETAIAFREVRRPGEAGEELRRRERALLEIAVDFTASAARRGLMDAPDPRLAALVVYGAAERLYYEAITGAEVQDPAGAAREVVRMFSRAFGMPSPPSVRLTGAGTDR
jgi:AcrR family transcriptional regulator